CLPADFDPTYYITRGYLDQSPQQLARLHTGPDDVVRTFVARAMRQTQLRTGWGGLALAVMLGAIAVALVVVLVWGSAQTRIVALGAVGLAVVLVLVSLVFAEHYDLYALSRFGIRRLFDYAGVPFVLLAAAVGETGLDRIDALERSPDPAPRRPDVPGE